MNIASLDLCRELYELSGWDDTKNIDYVYYSNGGEVTRNYYHREDVFDKPDNLPAYDLGYLLRKLPDSTLLSKFDNSDYAAVCGPNTLQNADTPEDAACKLCVALFKEGILKRGK